MNTRYTIRRPPNNPLTIADRRTAHGESDEARRPEPLALPNPEVFVLHFRVLRGSLSALKGKRR
jgi:hypothetical protein